MSNKNVKSFFKAVFNKNEDESYYYRFDDYLYHRFKGVNVCRIQRVGTRDFFYWTAENILNDDDVMNGISRRDLLCIERHYQNELKMKGTLNVIESDRKGTILLEDYKGKRTRYAEKAMLMDDELISKLSSLESARLGYRVGNRQSINNSCGKKEDFKSSLISKLPFGNRKK